MVDREDDLKLGIKSSAILFGDMDRLITGLLQLLVLISMGAGRVSIESGALVFCSTGNCRAIFCLPAVSRKGSFSPAML